jgi:hypothetical protein
MHGMNNIKQYKEVKETLKFSPSPQTVSGRTKIKEGYGHGNFL